jgi:hypothetical protein
MVHYLNSIFVNDFFQHTIQGSSIYHNEVFFIRAQHS